MMKSFINTAFSFIATSFMYLIGGLDLAFKTLAIMMVLDYITGVISAIYNKYIIKEKDTQVSYSITSPDSSSTRIGLAI